MAENIASHGKTVRFDRIQSQHTVFVAVYTSELSRSRTMSSSYQPVLSWPQKYSIWLKLTTRFYPRDAMLARVIVIATCPSVRLSVCPSVHHAPVLCQNEES